MVLYRDLFVNEVRLASQPKTKDSFGYCLETMRGVRAVAVEVLQLLARFYVDSKLKITFFGPSRVHVKERKVRAPSSRPLLLGGLLRGSSDLARY
jgi:hypothetical protein